MAAKSFIPRGSGNLIRDLLSPTCSIPLNKLHLKVDPKLNYPPELFSYFLPQRIDAIRITSLSPCLICSVDTELNPISSAETEILNQMRLKISKTRGNYAMVRDSSICATCRKMMGKMRKLRQQLVKIETCLKFAIRLKLDKVEEAGEWYTIIYASVFRHIHTYVPVQKLFPHLKFAEFTYIWNKCALTIHLKMNKYSFSNFEFFHLFPNINSVNFKWRNVLFIYVKLHEFPMY